MIKITVQGHLTLKGLVGKRQVSLPEGENLRAALDALREELGEGFEKEILDGTGALSGRIMVLLNGIHYRHLPEGLSTLLKDGDQIAIFPPLIGG